jgi:GNAT superfamily N-acetyltransferase
MIHYSTSERLNSDEYLEFLTRCDLGLQYPEEDFLERIETLLKNTTLVATARNDEGLLIGIAMGLTDFAYYLLLTELGVDREYVKQGIGSALLHKIHEAAGGEKRISIILDSYDPAKVFYEKFGMHTSPSLMYYDKAPWTQFTLTSEKLASLKDETGKGS